MMSTAARPLYVLALVFTAPPWPTLEAQQVAHFTFQGRPRWSAAVDPPRMRGGVQGRRSLSTNVQSEPRRYGRAEVGFGAGVTLGAVALTGVLTSGNGNACTGSGDYLRLCRGVFVAGTALSGGIGALVGGLMRSDSPSGRVRPVLFGSALGAVVPFAVSIPLCSQENHNNPDALCAYHGMTNPGVTVAAAMAGGLLGYLIGGRFKSLQVPHIGPAALPQSRTAVEVSFATALSGGNS